MQQGSLLPQARLQELQDLFSVVVYETRKGIMLIEERLQGQDFKGLQSLFKLKLIGSV
jgi:hypothetical protein